MGKIVLSTITISLPPTLSLIGTLPVSAFIIAGFNQKYQV